MESSLQEAEKNGGCGAAVVPTRHRIQTERCSLSPLVHQYVALIARSGAISFDM